jgi:hypothetical protein
MSFTANNHAQNLNNKRAMPFGQTIDLEPATKRQKIETSSSSQATCTPASEGGNLQSKQDLILEMVRLVSDEFNCNHQQDLMAAQAKIYGREAEEEKIVRFLQDNMTSGRSGLMYLCG